MASSQQILVLKINAEGHRVELGYTQELRRDLGLLYDFGASFSIVVLMNTSLREGYVCRC